MNRDLGPAFTRAQAVVNGLVAAIPGLVVALVVFGAFLLAAAIVKGVVARLTETRLHARRDAGVAVGRLAQGLVIFLGLLVAPAVPLVGFRPSDVVQVLGIGSAIGCAFRTSSVNLRARWWIAPPKRADALDARDKVLSATKTQLTFHGMDLPFPTQQSLFHDHTEDSEGDRLRQRQGWPAGHTDVPASRKVADAIQHLSGPKPRAAEGE